MPSLAPMLTTYKDGGPHWCQNYMALVVPRRVRTQTPNTFQTTQHTHTLIQSRSMVSQKKKDCTSSPLLCTRKNNETPFSKRMISLSGLFLVASAAVVAVVLYVGLIKPFMTIRMFAKQGVPGVPFRPFLGELPDVIASIKSDDCWTADRTFVRQYGGVYTTCFGPFPRLVLTDPRYIQDVLVRKSKSYHKTDEGKRVLGPLLGEGLFFSEDSTWKKHRSMINPAFHAVNLKNMMSIMSEATELAVSRWTLLVGGKDAGPIDIHKEMSNLTLDIVATATMGSSFRNSPEVGEAVYTAFTSVLDDIQKRNLNLTGLIPGLNSLPTASLRRIQDGVQRIQDVVMKVVNDRRKGSSHSLCDGKDLLDLILEARSEDGYKLSEVQIKDEAMTFILAGHETTSNLLTWTVAVLGQRKDVQDKCHEEINRVFKEHGEFSFDALKDMPVSCMLLLCLERMYPFSGSDSLSLSPSLSFFHSLSLSNSLSLSLSL